MRHGRSSAAHASARQPRSARTRPQLTESLGALDVALSNDDIARIEETVPASAVAGTRYDEHQMRILDSERA